MRFEVICLSFCNETCKYNFNQRCMFKNENRFVEDCTYFCYLIFGRFGPINYDVYIYGYNNYEVDFSFDINIFFKELKFIEEVLP